MLNGDDLAVQQALAERTAIGLGNLLGSTDLLALDEAQVVPGIGAILKLLVDSRPDVAVLATGSSRFDLGRSVGEPLTGRSRHLTLHPLAQTELGPLENHVETGARLATRLVYGGYPDVVTAGDDRTRQELLIELVNAYLFKDILQVEGLRRADKLSRLLQLLAMQIGAQISVQELGSQLGLSRGVVERLLDLLEQCFVISRLGGFSRNLRKEISKSSRWYFLDNGVRNALLRNFNPPSLREDLGALWENYLVVERHKGLDLAGRHANRWFWRTHDRQEIDLVEEENGRLSSWEFKWSAPRRDSVPSAWRMGYPNAGYQVIHRDNHLPFIIPDGPTT